MTDEEKADERRALAWLGTKEYDGSIVQSLAKQFAAIRAEQSAELEKAQSLLLDLHENHECGAAVDKKLRAYLDERGIAHCFSPVGDKP